MAATIVDIARVAGVGEATVVRALRGSGYVSATTKAKVEKVAKELGYHPNHIARSLVLGKSEFIGIMTGASVITAINPVIGPMEQGIREAGYSMLLFIAAGNSEEAERACLQELLNKRVAGVVLLPGTLEADPESYRQLLDSGIKTVVIDKNVEGLEAPQIIVDHYASGRLAIEHILSLGHTKLAYLGIPETSYIGIQRAKGIRDAIEDAEMSLSQCIFMNVDVSEQAGIDAANKLLEMSDRPTGVIVRHDNVAIGVMQALIAAGLSIPGDISIVSHGDIWPSHALRVPLTTVHAPMQRMGVLAIDKLTAMLKGENVPTETTVLDVELVVRESTGPRK